LVIAIVSTARALPRHLPIEYPIHDGIGSSGCGRPSTKMRRTSPSPSNSSVSWVGVWMIFSGRVEVFSVLRGVPKGMQKYVESKRRGSKASSFDCAAGVSCNADASHGSPDSGMLTHVPERSVCCATADALPKASDSSSSADVMRMDIRGLAKLCLLA